MCDPLMDLGLLLLQAPLIMLALRLLETPLVVPAGWKPGRGETLLIALGAFVAVTFMPLARLAAAPASSDAYRLIDLADLKVDKVQMQGMKILTMGRYTAFGEVSMLATGIGDTTPVLIDIAHVDRAQRRSLIDCGLYNCVVTVQGSVGNVLYQIGIIADSVEILADVSAEEIFRLRNVQTRGVTENNLPAILVTAEVVNLSPITRAAPKVKVSLNDIHNHELQVWTFPLSEDRLLPGQSVPFNTTITQPDQAAVSVSVAVVGGG